MSVSLWESEIYSKKKIERNRETREADTDKELHKAMDREGKTMIWDKLKEEEKGRGKGHV